MPLVTVKVYEQRVTPEFSAKVIEPGTIVLVPITDRARGGFGHSAV